MKYSVYNRLKNSSKYQYPIDKKYVTNQWDCINRAEYFIWKSAKGRLYTEPNHIADRRANLARARYYLGLAREMRENKKPSIPWPFGRGFGAKIQYMRVDRLIRNN